MPRRAKALLNQCLLARGALDAVCDVTYTGETRRTIPVAGSRSPEYFPSRRHLELREQTSPSSASYAERGLHACLQALRPASRTGGVHRRGVGGPIAPTIVTPALQVHHGWVQDWRSFLPDLRLR